MQYKILRYRVPAILTHGVRGRPAECLLTSQLTKDIHAMQAGSGKQAEHMSAVYARAQQYSNETEHLYSSVGRI